MQVISYNNVASLEGEGGCLNIPFLCRWFVFVGVDVIKNDWILCRQSRHQYMYNLIGNIISFFWQNDGFSFAD
jgi:hypothetical protein